MSEGETLFSRNPAGGEILTTPQDAPLSHGATVGITAARPFAATPPEHLENLGLQETLQIACGKGAPTDVDSYGCWLGASVLPFAVAPTGDVYVLLGKEREDQTWKCGSNRWSDFGGRRSVEQDRDCAETAGREFWEESCCVVSDVASWFGSFSKERSSAGFVPTTGGSGSVGFSTKRATPGASHTRPRPQTNSVRDPRKELANLFRRGCYTYRLVRTGNVRPIPSLATEETGVEEATLVDSLGKPSSCSSSNPKSVPDVFVADASCGLEGAKAGSKPAAIVGKSYVTFACRVPWDPAVSEKFHVAVGWLGCLYDAVRLFHMTFYDLFALPEEARPLRRVTRVLQVPANSEEEGAPLPSRRASVVNFSSSGLTAAESLGSMPRITLGMILPHLREASLLSPLPSSGGFPKSATVVSVEWDSARRVGRITYGGRSFAPTNSTVSGNRNPWCSQTVAQHPGADAIEFWISPFAASGPTLVDALLAIQELVVRRERVKTLYRSVPPDLAHHPSVSTETSPDGDLFSVVVKTEFLEKQAIQWWSLPRLTEMMANNGVYRTEQTRSSCNEMLSVVCQLLAHDFGHGRTPKRSTSSGASSYFPTRDSTRSYAPKPFDYLQ